MNTDLELFADQLYKLYINANYATRIVNIKSLI